MSGKSAAVRGLQSILFLLGRLKEVSECRKGFYINTNKMIK